ALQFGKRVGRGLGLYQETGHGVSIGAILGADQRLRFRTAAEASSGARAAHVPDAEPTLPEGRSIRSSRATSRKRQNAFASFICFGLRQSGSNSRGLPTTMQVHLAREVATLNRLGL